MLISSIGYKSLAVARIIKGNILDTIKLTPSVTTLNEIEIKPNKVIRLGSQYEKRHAKVERITRPEASYVQFIPNETNIKATIFSITCKINNKLYAIDKPFRVRLFTKAPSGITLGDELTTDSIIVYNTERKHKIDVDVSKYNISLPSNGVLVVFEVLSKDYYDGNLVLYEGGQYYKTPGIVMEQTKNEWQPDYEKKNRTGPYAMVGPSADLWNNSNSNWYVYKEGNNFAITITVVE